MAASAIALADSYHRVIVALAVLSTVAVLLRMIARWRSKVPFAIDDILIGVAWLFMVGSVINGFYMYVVGGVGQDLSTLSSYQIEVFFKAFYVSQIFYYLTMTATKLSILFLYSRIFVRPKFHLVTLLVICMVIFWCVGGLFPTIFQCQPIATAWNPNIVGTCINVPQLFLAGTIANLLTDVTILCLPVSVIWSLKLSKWDRLVVLGVFLVGSLVCVVALLRVTAQIGMGHSNPTVDLMPYTLWTALEPELAIICACIPTLKCLLPNPAYPSFLSKFSFNSAATNSNPHSSSNKPKSPHIPKSGYNLTFESSRCVHATAMIVSPAPADEYPLQGYPLRGYREIGEDKDVGRGWGKAWYEREEILNEGSGVEAEMGTIRVRKEISIV
ncbi:hypothetical protein MMC11_005032 [Xylographa trunciseda]|nr:hypothetical protein [Xylographa trunciseda]